MAFFPSQKEEALINAVESRPTLYGRGERNYSNRDVSGKLWLKVAEQIIGLDATSCKVKWQSLRDYYLRKRRENTKKSGQAASNKRQWCLYDRMSFLEPFVAGRETSGNLDNAASTATDHEDTVTDFTGDSNADSQQPADEPQFVSSEESAVAISTASKSGTKKRKLNQQDMIDKEILKALQKDQEKEHELFFKSLIPTVSQLNSIQKMLFRADVQHLAVKYLKQQQASRSSTLASPPLSLSCRTLDDHYIGHHSRSSTPRASANKKPTEDQQYLRQQYATSSSASSALSHQDTLEDNTCCYQYYPTQERM